MELRSDMKVESTNLLGTDDEIMNIAKVSTLKDTNILYDMEFEHNLLQFRIEAPIFVWREFHLLIQWTVWQIHETTPTLLHSIGRETETLEENGTV